jgi:hypothetical protein
MVIQWIRNDILGTSEFRPDGTYITTESITAFYLRLIPVRSFRVRYQGPGGRKVPIGFGSAQRYAVFEKTAPNWKQVLSVYALIVLYVAWLCLVLQIARQLSPNGLEGQNLGFFALALAVLGPLTIPLIVRRRARERGGAGEPSGVQATRETTTGQLSTMPPRAAKKNGAAGAAGRMEVLIYLARFFFVTRKVTL